jgi:1-phosphatidylinositol-4-phosphate 5-kinase
MLKGMRICEQDIGVTEESKTCESFYDLFYEDGAGKCKFFFKSYHKRKFKELRELSGITTEAYISDMGSDYIVSKGSRGKSGALLFFLKNFNFVVKTIRSREKRCLLNILNDYIEYMRNHPNSLICRFYGCYRIRVEGCETIYFIVMNNIFPFDREIHEIYDLKGSFYNRTAKNESSNSTKKDLDWYINQRKLYLFGKRIILVKQIREDTCFLKSHGIMDYSLLIGINICSKGMEGCVKKNFTMYTNGEYAKPVVIRCDISENNLPRGVSNVFSRDFGGYSSEEIEGFEPELYYIGIIDVLTSWSFKKRMERVIGKLFCKKGISCTDPETYMNRFLGMVNECVFYNPQRM